MHKYASVGRGLRSAIHFGRIGVVALRWHLILAIAAVALAIVPTTADAAVYYWDLNGDTAGSGGPSPSGTWDTVASNWNESIDGTGSPTTFPDSIAFSNAVFSAGTDAIDAYNVTASGTINTNSIKFSHGSVTLLGSDTPSLNIGGSGITIDAIAGATTLGSSLGTGGASGVVVATSQNWANNSVELFTVNSDVVSGSTDPVTLALTGTGAGGTTFNGVLKDNSVTNTLALTVSTTGGVTTLTGANTHTGATTLTAGTLRLTNTAALSTSALKLNGGTLQLRSDTSATFATASTAIGGNVTFDVNQASSGADQTLSLGAVSLVNNKTINVTGGNGYTLSLGAITVNSGGNGTTIINPTTGNITTAGINFTTGNGNLTKTGAGTWTITGTVNLNGYPGNLTVSAGTLKMGVINSWATPTGATNLVVNGGILDLAGYSQASAQFNGTGGTVTNSSTTPCTLTINARDNKYGSTYAGTITDSGGSGTLGLSLALNTSIGNPTQTLTLTLGGTNNSYTGVTTIQGNTGWQYGIRRRVTIS